MNTQGGGILLLGATYTLVTHNNVTGNVGHQFNSGGIVVLSAGELTDGSDRNFVTITDNLARQRPVPSASGADGP